MTELQPIIVFCNRHFVCHLRIGNRICVKLLQLMCAINTHMSVIKRSISINRDTSELRPIIVFHGRHFVRLLGICNLICFKLLQIMSGVIPRTLQKTIFSNCFPGVHKRGIHTQIRTHMTIA